jgi:aldose 1-epimerase
LELVDSLPTGNLIDLEGQYDLRQPRSTSDLVLDDIFTDLIADVDGVVRCRLIDQASQVETVVESNIAQFRHVVVYTPPAPRQAICIEPNSSPTDAFNLQARGIDSDMIVLKPGEAASFEVVILSRAASELLVDIGR